MSEQPVLPASSSTHPTSAEMADAVAASEEMNTADEAYAAEMAELREADGATDEALVRPGEFDTAPASPAIADDVEDLTDGSRDEVADRTGGLDPADAPDPAVAQPAAEDSADSEGGGETPAHQSSPSADPQDEADAVAPAEPIHGHAAGPAEPQDQGDAPADADAHDQPGAPTDADAPHDDTAADADSPAVDADTTPDTDGAAPQSDTRPADRRPGGSPARPPKPGSVRPGGHPGPGNRRPSPIPPPAGRPTGGRPGAAPQPRTDALVEASDPTPWGRIDASGTVFVVTADGEREVGYWQAGDAATGLAHYGRRYDDFVTEIVVLETRLSSGASDIKAVRSHAALLRQSIDTLPAVGDLATAAQRLDAVVAAADAAAAGAAQERASARAAAMARRESLCVEAEELAESTQWKASGDRLKEIVEEWRTIRGLDRRTDDQLWKRFSKARDTFIRRRGSHFAEMDKERGKTKEVKEALIAKAEKLADSTDWAATAAEYRTLMSEWKAAGRTGRDVEDALWERFRGAQETFFSRRQQTFASRDAEFEGNAAVKEKLLAEAEKIDPATNLDAAKAALRSVQARWEDAGKVPRERIRSLDGRLRAVEDRIKAAEDSHWRRTDPEATARLGQFKARYESYQAQADKATAAGDPKRAAAAQAQADQWLEWLKAAQSAVD